MFRPFFSICLLLVATLSVNSFLAVRTLTAENSPNPAAFLNVPNEAKPWVYYWWLKGNVSKEQITRDLEEMQKKGVGGILLFDSRGYHDDFDSKNHVPVPLHIKHEFMSPEWREMIKHTIREADRCGIQVSMNIANTGGLLRGPWDMKEDGPKELRWSSCRVTGPTTFEAALTIPTEMGDKNTDRFRNLSVSDAPLASPVQERHYRDVIFLGVRTEGGNVESADSLNGPMKKAEIPKNGSAPMAVEVVDLSDKFKDGKLQWNVPVGEWTILRFGYEIVGDVGSVDILSKEACTKYFHLIGSELVKDAGPLAGKTLTHFYNVSWEGSAPDWTPGFEQTFTDQNGYEIRPYMPVLAGMTVGNLAKTDRFWHDYYRTISYCFRKNCYAVIGKLCHERNMLWHSENGGPWNRARPKFKEADMISFLGENDIPQGEFWVTESNYATRSNMRLTAMAAHIYGQKEAAVEAFTHMVRHWTMYPARLKPAADVNFIDGANKFVWHTFTASPPELGLPGFEYFAGTHLNTNVTWWNDVTPFMTYLGRCQYMLRQGHFTADACVYVSYKNFVNWGRLEKWNPNSTLKLPDGYTYDLLDTEVLVDRLAFNDGKLVLPDGMSYRFLVLDPLEEILPMETLQKIVNLVREGATVVLGNKQTVRTPGLKNHPDCDRQVAELAEQLWGSPGATGNIRTLGKGKIVTGISMEQFLAEEKIPPDFVGPFEYHHRTLLDKNIYFLTNGEQPKRVDCVFRVNNKMPMIWNAVDGTISPPSGYRYTEDGRTEVMIDMPAFGSCFVVFDAPASHDTVTKTTGPDTGVQVRPSQPAEFAVTLWKPGEYRLTTIKGKTHEIKADLPSAIPLQGDWEVRFDPKWGGPEKTTFEKLTLWNEHADPGIKFYSGTATYVKKFVLKEDHVGMPARLSVQAAHDTARVRINGKDLGVLWTHPRVVDISSACKAGDNVLEIDVTNCWANRLIGDAGLPKEKRLTKTNLYLVPERKTEDWTYRAFQGFAANDPLLRSGLLGPIVIEFGTDRKIDLSTQ